MKKIIPLLTAILVFFEFYFEFHLDQTKLYFCNSLTYISIFIFYIVGNSEKSRVNIYFSLSFLFLIITPLVLVFESSFNVFFGFQFISYLSYLVFQTLFLVQIDKEHNKSFQINRSDSKYVIGVIAGVWMFFLLNFLELDLLIILKIVLYIFVFCYWAIYMFKLKENTKIPALIIYAVVSITLVSIFGSYALFIEKFKFEAQFIRIIHVSGLYSMVLVAKNLKSARN